MEKHKVLHISVCVRVCAFAGTACACMRVALFSMQSAVLHFSTLSQKRMIFERKKKVY
jgi:hypothetical protein